MFQGTYPVTVPILYVLQCPLASHQSLPRNTSIRAEHLHYKLQWKENSGIIMK